MESKPTEAQRYVRAGAIALEIDLHEFEVTIDCLDKYELVDVEGDGDGNEKEAVQILAPRRGYLPLLVPQFKHFFSSTSPSGVDTVWLEYKGLPLKWKSYANSYF